MGRWRGRSAVLADPLASWRLEGFDTFAEEYYPLPGTFRTREEAEVAAESWRAKFRESPGSPELRDRVLILPPGIRGDVGGDNRPA